MLVFSPACLKVAVLRCTQGVRPSYSNPKSLKGCEGIIVSYCLSAGTLQRHHHRGRISRCFLLQSLNICSWICRNTITAQIHTLYLCAADDNIPCLSCIRASARVSPGLSWSCNRSERKASRSSTGRCEAGAIQAYRAV